MSDIDLDDLSEAARNRGLKLVRSRVRTPTKRRFGKVGLTDSSGKPVLGVDQKGPTATPDKIQAYLRKLDTQDWGASLDVAAPQRKRKTARAPGEAANDTYAAPAPTPASPKSRLKPKPRPGPRIREAKPADSPRLVELIRELGHEIDENSVRRNLSKLKAAGELPLVAALGEEVVGMIGRHAMTTVHRAQPVGRIPMLIVAEEARGQEIGRMLVEAAEQWMRKKGCKLVEVTSNDRRAEAHAFYRHIGYERTSIRFAKSL